jgi:aryl sulfotransferase
MHRVLAAQTHRRAMKSHMPADAIPWYPQAKYITVGRDGRDAFMSWCNHVSRMKMIDAMAAQAESEGLPVPAKFDGNYRAYFRHWVANENNFFEVVSSYWAIRDRPNLLFAHYNDMKADLEGEMRRVAEFLEIDVPAAKWPQVVERCTFESMRNSKNVADLDRMFEGGVQGFIFKGTNGRWREVLGDEEVELYRKQVAATLSDECARWVEGGRHAIGLR